MLREIPIVPAHMRNCASGAGTHSHRLELLREIPRPACRIIAAAAYGSRIGWVPDRRSLCSLVRDDSEFAALALPFPDIASPSRGTICPSFAKTFSLEEGAGNAGCTLHPRSRVQIAQRNAHTSIQVQRRHSGIPCAMVLRLISCSPRRRIRLVTVVDGLKVSCAPGWARKTSADLTPATGARTTRFCRTLQRRSSCAP
jgi:hypothetical protein